MSVYVIACLTPNPEHQDDYETYLRVAMPLLDKVGGKLSQHFPVGDVVVGNKPAEAIMVVEYPDMDAVHALFQSEEYKALIPVRDRAFSTYSVSIVS
ncbi:DUF1330 domain-containing protein [Mameliella sediminis]|uniref:DUF1330 domain-containing protein n=1 Tax=Mameliella sediminis TaxID=2836866 RepID=UPI001C496A75|nr:DUF1330 domain-containing protein [Mameliella sediminis]MBV7395996.1 DUF1330 domain-containing protein [Mameliella sediminis]